uniref:Histone-lysine N-methyltransferase SETMAR n=1 Tax=Anisakis simplex TaxID=6269 RepID=A0A0M3JIG5_ANISI
LLRDAVALAKRWISANDSDLPKFTDADFKNLSSPLKLKVLDTIRTVRFMSF